jgi:excinuclease ABC subunit C
MPSQETPLNARLDIVPASPGVYLMKDAGGRVIYVGKAVNLQSRLRSYFGPTPRGNNKVMAMISHVRDFDYVVCSSEMEALILENNLIKRYEPHYNILLRDDREYPYIRVTLNEEYPRILKAFHVGPDREKGARYYGPYLSGDLYYAMRALRDIFPTKTCKRVRRATSEKSVPVSTTTSAGASAPAGRCSSVRLPRGGRQHLPVFGR